MASAITIGEMVSEQVLASWRLVQQRVRTLPVSYRKEVLRTISEDVGDLADAMKELPR